MRTRRRIRSLLRSCRITLNQVSLERPTLHIKARDKLHKDGFYGNLRGSKRNDVYDEFRQACRPLPPSRFLQRAEVPANRHTYSRHDNRQMYLSSGVYFLNGNGIRKNIPNSIKPSDPDFFAWLPMKNELRYQQPMCSNYKETFTHDSRPGPDFQMYAPFVRHCRRATPPSTKAEAEPQAEAEPLIGDGRPLDTSIYNTSYRTRHNSAAIHETTLEKVNFTTRKAATAKREGARTTPRTVQGGSVRECLTWPVPSRPFSSEPVLKEIAQRKAGNFPPQLTLTTTATNAPNSKKSVEPSLTQNLDARGVIFQTTTAK